MVSQTGRKLAMKSMALWPERSATGRACRPGVALYRQREKVGGLVLESKQKNSNDFPSHRMPYIGKTPNSW